jgi:PAS domain S-box-containing protein
MSDDTRSPDGGTPEGPELFEGQTGRHDGVAENANEEREILDLIVENLGDGVVVADATGRFVLFNPAAERILGLGMTDSSPERWSEVYGVYYPDRVTPFPSSELPLVCALSGRKKRNVEMFIRHAARPEGGYISVTGTPLMRGSEVRGAVVVFRDITREKQADEARRLLELAKHQAEERRKIEAELEQVRDSLVRQTRLSAIGELAASIAHDLRNPLGAIRNSVYYLGRRVSDGHPDWRRHLEIIEQEVRTSNRIIDNLLDLSRSRMAEPEWVDLGLAVADAIGPDEAATEVQVEVTLQSNPYMVWADPGLLRRLLANLLANAVQAQTAGGRVSIEAETEGSFDRIRISDDGPGVPAPLRERIFEPLFTTRAKGTGLGLAICRRICERHGGTIELDDRDGPGATFTIRLPRHGG